MEHSLDRRQYQYPRSEKSPLCDPTHEETGFSWGIHCVDMQTAEKGAVGMLFLGFLLVKC